LRWADGATNGVEPHRGEDEGRKYRAYRPLISVRRELNMDSQSVTNIS
jgi:hypothetical protein